MSESIPPERWRWFGSPMHCIIGPRCIFHLATQVGEYLISTIGNYRPEGHNRPMDSFGPDRYYELMVFPCGQEKRECGCPKVESWSNIDARVWPENATHEEVEAGHLEMCRKYAAIAQNEVTIIDDLVQEHPAQEKFAEWARRLREHRDWHEDNSFGKVLCVSMSQIEESGCDGSWRFAHGMDAVYWWLAFDAHEDVNEWLRIHQNQLRSAYNDPGGIQ